jgi:hypothetical protein
MKMLIENEEKEGLPALMGEVITVICASYIYTGKLVGVNSSCIKLENPSIVYETGRFDDPNWADAQKIINHSKKIIKDFFYLQTGMIEGFGLLK